MSSRGKAPRSSTNLGESEKTLLDEGWETRMNVARRTNGKSFTLMMTGGDTIPESDIFSYNFGNDDGQENVNINEETTTGIEKFMNNNIKSTSGISNKSNSGIFTLANSAVKPSAKQIGVFRKNPFSESKSLELKESLQGKLEKEDWLENISGEDTQRIRDYVENLTKPSLKTLTIINSPVDVNRAFSLNTPTPQFNNLTSTFQTPLPPLEQDATNQYNTSPKPPQLDILNNSSSPQNHRTSADRIATVGPEHQQSNEEEDAASYHPFSGDRGLLARVDARTGGLLALYTGELSDGLPHGLGRLSYSGLEYYDGKFCRGFADGQGVLVTAAYRYSGGFALGLFQGHGNLTIFNKGSYEGGFREGKFEGKGKFTWTDHPRMYIGSWKDSLFHGKGLMMWGDGRKYYGEYSQGKKHGKGLCILAGGAQISGYWFQGKLVKKNER